MKKHSSLLTAGIFGCSLILISFSSGPGGNGQQVTGAPGEGNCTGCHSSNALNSGGGSVRISVDGGVTSYIPGNTYTVNVTGTGSSASKYGFQMVALKGSDNTNIGTFTATSGNKISAINGKDYIEHSTTSSSGSWQFQWTAPSSDVGNVNFYVAGNSAESPNGTNGDNIYTNSLTLEAATTTSITQKETTEISLAPNPSNEQTSLTFTTREAGPTMITVTDLNGKEVLLVQKNSILGAGTHQVTINTSGLEAGIYFVIIKGKNHKTMVKLINR